MNRSNILGRALSWAVISACSSMCGIAIAACWTTERTYCPDDPSRCPATSTDCESSSAVYADPANWYDDCTKQVEQGAVSPAENESNATCGAVFACENGTPQGGGEYECIESASGDPNTIGFHMCDETTCPSK